MDDDFLKAQELINTLAKKYSETEKDSDKLNLIKSKISQAKKAKQAMDKEKIKLDRYNLAVEHIQKISQIKGQSMKPPINTQESLDAYLEHQLNSINCNMMHMRDDQNIINNFNKKIIPIAKNGYKAIMELRTSLTGQEIIYAVQGIKSTTTYHVYITENEYLDLISDNPKLNPKEALQIIDTQKYNRTPTLKIDFSKIKEKSNNGVKVKSRDILYQKISKYIDASKSKKLQTWQAWEAYTEAKSYFKDRSFSDKDFDKWIGKFLNRGKLKIKTFNGTTDKITSRAMSSLAFYQGGDTATYSRYVMVQNKSSSDYYSAQINISSIYNALTYIDEIFKENQSINISKVQTLFTATLDNRKMPQGFFKDANQYAREQIENNIKLLNKNIKINLTN